MWNEVRMERKLVLLNYSNHLWPDIFFFLCIDPMEFIDSFYLMILGVNWITLRKIFSIALLWIFLIINHQFKSACLASYMKSPRLMIC